MDRGQSQLPTGDRRTSPQDGRSMCHRWNPGPLTFFRSRCPGISPFLRFRTRQGEGNGVASVTASSSNASTSGPLDDCPEDGSPGRVRKRRHNRIPPRHRTSSDSIHPERPGGRSLGNTAQCSGATDMRRRSRESIRVDFRAGPVPPARRARRGQRHRAGSRRPRNCARRSAPPHGGFPAPTRGGDG